MTQRKHIFFLHLEHEIWIFPLPHDWHLRRLANMGMRRLLSALSPKDKTKLTYSTPGRTRTCNLRISIPHQVSLTTWYTRLVGWTISSPSQVHCVWSLRIPGQLGFLGVAVGNCSLTGFPDTAVSTTCVPPKWGLASSCWPFANLPHVGSF